MLKLKHIVKFQPLDLGVTSLYKYLSVVIPKVSSLDTHEESARCSCSKPMHHQKYPSSHYLLGKQTLGQTDLSRIELSNIPMSLVYEKTFQRAEVKGLNVDIS